MRTDRSKFTWSVLCCQLRYLFVFADDSAWNADTFHVKIRPVYNMEFYAFLYV